MSDFATNKTEKAPIPGKIFAVCRGVVQCFKASRGKMFILKLMIRIPVKNATCPAISTI
mgnify:CR=1 FL=1